MDWSTLIIGGIVGALITIPFTIVYDLFLKSWVKSVYSKSIFSSKQKRINSVIDEYLATKQYSKDHDLFIFRLFQRISVMLVTIAYLIVMIGLVVLSKVEFAENKILYLIAVAVLLGYHFLIVLASDNLKIMIRDVVNLNEYKEKTVKKLIKLGGNPEDLDKDDTKE